MSDPLTQPDAPPFPQVGAVAIGRNEGQRLNACLRSLLGQVARVVYVDSGSTDGSPEMARQMGADVINLDMSEPFTAARARNTGFTRLMTLQPDIEYVQFVDGDCEVVPDWVEIAVATLKRDARLGVVCGRRRERHPEASVYNQLCDIEWDTPAGEARACGGDAMIRAAAFQQVEGYNPRVIAGEEPEMCVRLRARGWAIQRLGVDMTWHDAAMTRFGQWWRRNVRAGHAYAEGEALHGGPPERHNVKQVRSNWAWGFTLPVAALALGWPSKGLSLLLLGAYGVLAWRVHQSALARGMDERTARRYTTFIVLGKIPQALGQLKYRINRLRGRQSRIIEYKGVGARVPAAQPAGHGSGA